MTTAEKKQVQQESAKPFVRRFAVKLARKLNPLLRRVFRVSESCGCCQAYSSCMGWFFVVKLYITAMLHHGRYLRVRYTPPYWMSPLRCLRRRVRSTVNPIYVLYDCFVACKTNKQHSNNLITYKLCSDVSELVNCPLDVREFVRGFCSAAAIPLMDISRSNPT